MRKNLIQHKFQAHLDTSYSNIVKDFFEPSLSLSTRYDRAVGFFSSGWLKLNASGMLNFANNNGYARWITSPILSKDDWDAMLQGDQARRDNILWKTLHKNILSLSEALETNVLSALAWMVADGIIDFRLALPANELTGEFHTKFGIFTDQDGNSVSFDGSYNDSIQGTRNYESIKIFCSWNEHQAAIVHHDKERFEKLWCNEDPNVVIYDLPEAVRYEILRLRKSERPYAPPKHSTNLDKARQHLPRRPSGLILRDYQEEAIRAWFSQNSQGLLEMATGTGKTVTALAAMIRLFGQQHRLAVIITCPYQHLVDQWKQEAIEFNLLPLLAYQRKSSWLASFRQQVAEYNHGDRSYLAVITTHTTFSDEDFQQILGYITGPTLLIADEVHHLGAIQRRNNLSQSIQFRLGLSATPDRWFDDVGTAILRSYFGNTAFQFSLKQAIGSVLTPYRYHPQLVELTPDELLDYQQITEQIGKLTNTDNPDLEDVLEMLLIKRARILNTAVNKLKVLSGLISELGSIKHALFYCAPEQIDEVCHLLGWDHNLIIHRFTAEETNDERQSLLKQFNLGELQGLVAMRCLDEGVDVPSTRIAFILASSSNPREFIQRRGRILRRSVGKQEAIIYDLITIPPQTWSSNISYNVERSIVQHEVHRFMEFADSATNKHQALGVIWNIARRYNIQ